MSFRKSDKKKLNKFIFEEIELKYLYIENIFATTKIYNCEFGRRRVRCSQFCKLILQIPNMFQPAPYTRHILYFIMLANNNIPREIERERIAHLRDE